MAWRVANPVEIGVGLRATSFGMSEPAAVKLLEEDLVGKASVDLGPTLRLHIPAGAATTVSLHSETRAVLAQVSRRRNEVTVMRYEDGPMDGHLYVADRHQEHSLGSPLLLRQVVGVSADHRLDDGWSLGGGVALQNQPVFEAHYTLRESCHGGSNCSPPESLTPSCHAAMATPWLGVTAPVGDAYLRGGLFGSFDLVPLACSYPDTIGLTLAAVGRR